MAKSLDIIDPKKELGEKEEKGESHDDLEEEKGGGAVFYLVIGIIAVVVATASAFYIIYHDSGKEKKSESGGITASDTATVEQTETATVQPTASPSAVSTAKSAFQYSDEKIRIVNGNGISGEAAKIKKLLEGKEYKISSIANASRRYAQSIIYYKEGQETLAEALKQDIKEEYSAEIKKSDTIVGIYDAIIALGTK